MENKCKFCGKDHSKDLNPPLHAVSREAVLGRGVLVGFLMAIGVFIIVVEMMLTLISALGVC